MSSSSEEEDMDTTPDFIREEASKAMEFLLPQCSKEKYLKVYSNFNMWRTEKGLKSLSESVFITYFNELSRTKQPSTLWSFYSMLKATVYTKHHINLKNYYKLNAFLKKQSVGFKSKKSKMFSAREVEMFIYEAPDDKYLATKVALILGISGGCKNMELLKMTTDDVQKHDKLVLVKLPNTKTKIDRTFVVREEFAKYVQKYQNCRPEDLHLNRFFLSYHNGKCLRQVVGKNKLNGLPKQIATYLDLPNPELYTGHCFRRTAVFLEKYGGWNSIKDAENKKSVVIKTKAQDTLSSGQKSADQPSVSAKDASQIRWETNESIDCDDYESIEIKEEPLPVIARIESMNNDQAKKPKKPSVKTIRQVCNLLGLNYRQPLQAIKQELRNKTASRHIQNIDGPKTTFCTSIYLTQLPLWFNYFHVKTLIQLKSDFDVDSESYYIDIFKDSDNKRTGECLLRFMENKDCLQVYRDLQGIQLSDGPIIVSLDLGHEIANKRDRYNPKFEEQLQKYNETRIRHEQNVVLPEEIETTVTVLKEEIEERPDNAPFEELCTKHEDYYLNTVKSGILEYAVEFDDYESIISNNIKQEPNYNDSERNTTDSTVILKSTESNNGNVDKNSTMQTDISKSNYDNIDRNIEDILIDEKIKFSNASKHGYDYYFDKCKIIHIKNTPTSQTFNCIYIIKELIMEKTGIEMKFQYRLVIDECKSVTPDILVQFESHEHAVIACRLLNGLTILGRKIEVVMGIGYQFKKNMTTSDLYYYQRLRKFIDDYDRENKKSTKRAKTENIYTTNTVDYSMGFMPPEENNADSYGLSREFMQKIEVKCPLTRWIIVSHLHPEVTEAKLNEVFSLAGEVRKVQLFTDVNKVLQAKIEYDHPLEAVQAISMFHKHKLYNEDMKVQMDYSRKERPLPLGLSSVGKGLGLKGQPLRGLRIEAELNKVYELLAALGGIDRIPNIKPAASKKKSKGMAQAMDNIYPFIFTYKKPKRMNAPEGNSMDTCKVSSASNWNVSASNLANTPNTQTRGSLPQGLTSTGTGSQSLQNILASLPNTNLNFAPTPSAPINATAPNLGNSTCEPNKVDPLNDAINRVMQFMTPNNVTLNMVQSNMAQHFQNSSVKELPTPATLPQTPANTLAQTKQNTLPRPGCSKEKDSRKRRYNDGSDSPQRRDSVEKDYWHRRDSVEKDYWERKDSVKKDYWQRKDSVEKDYWQRKDSVEKDSRLKRDNADKDSRSSRYSVEKDSRYSEEDSRYSRYNEEDSRYSRYSEEKDTRYNRYSEEKDSGYRRNSAERYSRRGDSEDDNSKRGRYNEDSDEEIDSRCSKYNEDKDSGRNKVSQMLVFKNLPLSVSSVSLGKKMREIGEVQVCEMMDTGRAFLRFLNPRDADRCIRQFHRAKVDGHIIEVSYL